MIARMLEIIGLIVLLFFVITQILIPGLMGRPFFPLFGSRKKKEDELALAKDLRDQAEIDKKINQEVEKAVKTGGKK